MVFLTQKLSFFAYNFVFNTFLTKNCKNVKKTHEDKDIFILQL